MESKQKAFLDSGVIEDYCLGLAAPADAALLLELCGQYPEVQVQVDQQLKSLDAILKSYAKRPPKRSRDIIKKSIADKLELKNAKLIGEDQMLEKFIAISRHSTAEDWDELLKGIQPVEEYDNIYAKPLFASESQELTLVWAKELVPDEIHVDVSESFFLLEGTVDCHVADEIYSMERGDYMLIPLHVHHKVVVTSETPGKALMSRVAI